MNNRFGKFFMSQCRWLRRQNEEDKGNLEVLIFMNNKKLSALKQAHIKSPFLPDIVFGKISTDD